METGPRIQLRALLLSNDEESLKRLQDVLDERIAEGMGETVFEIGYENNGTPMQLTADELSTAYRRLVQAAEGVRAKCQLLLTHNVGGDAEAASTIATPSKDKSCTGKVMVRRRPAHVEDAIETRIAVVGNGKHVGSLGRVTVR